VPHRVAVAKAHTVPMNVREGHHAAF
jgi:hypothetical protein